ncbi:MAG: hypothetical protein HQK99_15365 [Nitrospirae bacterium]|nr:hypothetical protein [Nitrospirota bacterium]
MNYKILLMLMAFALLLSGHSGNADAMSAPALSIVPVGEGTSVVVSADNVMYGADAWGIPQKGGNPVLLAKRHRHNSRNKWKRKHSRKGAAPPQQPMPQQPMQQQPMQQQPMQQPVH